MTVRIAPMPTRSSRVFRALGAYMHSQWQNAERLSAGLREIGLDNIDLVLIPHMESIGLVQLALRPRLCGGKPWATLAATLRFHLRQAGVRAPFRWLDLLYRALFHWVLRHPRLICFGTFDPYLQRTIRHSRIVYCPVHGEPPPRSPVADARRFYGIRPESRVVLVYGFLDYRKSIDILLEAAARVDPDLDLTVFLAGRQHNSQLSDIMNGEAARLLRERGRLVEANRFLMPGQDIDPVNAADIAWVFYGPAFVYPSSVLVRSAQVGLPVISRHQGVIGRLVEQTGCGLVVASAAPDEVAAALTRLVRDPTLRAELGANGARAFAGNTPEAFAQPIVDSIARALEGGR